MSMIVPQQCESTAEGWLWYCDAHDAHGNASSNEEAMFVVSAHADWWARQSNEDPGDVCDTYVIEIAD